MADLRNLMTLLGRSNLDETDYEYDEEAEETRLRSIIQSADADQNERIDLDEFVSPSRAPNSRRSSSRPSACSTRTARACSTRASSSAACAVSARAATTAPPSRKSLRSSIRAHGPDQLRGFAAAHGLGRQLISHVGAIAPHDRIAAPRPARVTTMPNTRYEPLRSVCCMRPGTRARQRARARAVFRRNAKAAIEQRGVPCPIGALALSAALYSEGPACVATERAGGPVEIRPTGRRRPAAARRCRAPVAARRADL